MAGALITSPRILGLAAAGLLVCSQLPAHTATRLGAPLSAVIDTATAPLRAPVYAFALRFVEPALLPVTPEAPQNLEQYDLALRLALTRVEALEQEVMRLRNSLDVANVVMEQVDIATSPLLAPVTGFTQTADKPVLTLGRGSRSGITPGLTVVWKTAVVGRVLDPVGPTSCRVELVTAHSAGLRVSVKSPPFAAPEFQHETFTLRVRPGPDQLHLVTDVEQDLPVRVGDLVHLADELHYPEARGMVVGQITDISEYVPEPLLRKQLTIRPQVDLRYLPEAVVLLPQ